jgi:PIN domain nuclease of toxin-antitoxin system
MRLLLDTHIALWAVADDARLSEQARDLIGDPENQERVSVASLWEIAIKHPLAGSGPNDMQVSAEAALRFFR